MPTQTAPAPADASLRLLRMAQEAKADVAGVLAACFPPPGLENLNESLRRELMRKGVLGAADSQVGAPPGRYDLLFLRKGEIMLLNGARLVTKVPAKILKYFLEGRVRENRSRFRVAELCTHPEIVSNFLKEPSVNIRLIRLQACLARKAPALEVIRSKGSGLVELRAACEVNYREADE